MTKTLFVWAAHICSPGLVLLVTALVAAPARAQNQELTFSLGGIPGQTRSFQSSAGTTQISADRSFGISYGHRFLDAKIAALYGEVEFVAIPNRGVTSATATVPQNYASLYLAPGLRLKFLPSSRLSPWAAIGGGYALYQQSAKFSNGQNDANDFSATPRSTSSVDYRRSRWFTARLGAPGSLS